MAFDLIAHLRVVDQATAPLRKMTAGFGKAVGAIGALTAAVGVTALAFKSLDKAMSFESQMSSIKALTGATADEMKRMQTLALKMGASTKYSALEAAAGIEELLKAGLTPAMVQAGGLEAALNLATAGELGLADAAEIMSTSLNAFKKDGISAAKASDILAGTANASATSVTEMRLSLAAVSAVAAGVGLTFEDTNIALGVFANMGLKSSDAGTSLKTMLQNLQPTSKTQIALFKKLGIVTANGGNEFFDAAGNIKSVADISGILRKSLGKLTNQQRSLALETMFGSDATRAANILYETGADGVKKFRDEMSKVTALDVAKKKMDNAAGAVEQFSGAIETLQIAALLPTMPLIKRFANSAASMVEKYTPQITAAIERMSTQASTFLDKHFTNNPEFQKLTTLEAKIKFVYEDIMASFKTWMSNGGSDKLAAVSQSVIDTLASTLKASQPLIDAAIRVGTAIGKGMLDGIKQFAKDNPELAQLGIFAATPGPIPVKIAAAVAAPGAMQASETWNDPDIPMWKKALAFPYEFFHGGRKLGEGTVFDKSNSHSGGISSVPRNNYPAVLHRGESVLPSGEARKYRNGGGSGGGVSVTGNTFVVRKDSDINDIATQLFHLINDADNAMGGAY
jgi:TP901 family phage tail tape measure protein